MGGARDPGRGIRVRDPAPPGPWAPQELPAPALSSPSGPAQFPGSGASPPGGGAEPGLRARSRPGGCARDSAAEAHLVRRSEEGARTERGTERRADGPTDGRPRTRRRTELGEVPVTHIHTHTLAQTHTGTHAHSRAHILPPAYPPARRRPESALAGKCGASVGAFVWGGGRWRARGPSQGAPATDTSSRPPGAEASARPRHAPVGLPTPRDWGRGPPRLGGDPALGRGERAAATPHEARARFRRGRGGIGMVVRGASLSAAVAGARLLAALPTSPGSEAPEEGWRSPLACWPVNRGSQPSLRFASPPPDRVA